MSRNNIIIPANTKVTVSRDGGPARPHTTSKDTEFSDWSSNRDGTLTARQIVRGVCWELTVDKSAVRVVSIRVDVPWSAGTAEHDRVHASGRGHELGEALRVRRLLAREKVVRLNEVRQANQASSALIREAIESADLAEVGVLALVRDEGLLADLRVSVLEHLTHRLLWGVRQVSYAVPSASKEGEYVVNLTCRRGQVVRADCGCKAGMRGKSCHHVRTARRAHQRIINAGCLLAEGVHPAEVVELLTGAAPREVVQ